jgi:hypothetical protein
MDAAQILREFGQMERLPEEAIRAAGADRASVAPIFLQTIERYLLEGGDISVQYALFFIFHVLGEWREKAAYRPLARLLRRPPDEIEGIFGDAVTDAHRVMAAVFDADPAPLYELILDAGADEFIRSAMCEAIAMVTLRGELPRAEVIGFLRACYDKLQPQDECWVWQGWQSAIALLGAAELKPLVEQAFARGFISPGWLSLQDFERDLQEGINDPGGPTNPAHGDFTLFGDTIEEFSSWFSSSDNEDNEDEDATGETGWLDTPPPGRFDAGAWGVPATNPLRHVGRNDPCPCGSGRKFKKCCLAAQASPSPPRAA